ncbi:FemAB family XrtA/PEP-CTERM system-associated protein [Hydrogenophaga intermedia]|uniref:FemAB family XrtA/PEP-CTERM system-associated protein n=1 Tax=Hydrogenophaga intermedia TaxID=65786 RepID=UPI002042DF6B|nr:FemAB family XrtA/PEP-CTERM system-associated protein [Hydrogenophaga intermedia]MCM3563275.1 FemAB family PEP-CTERM system-associated protein [Hydrogenophaga intermedia]
MQVLRLDGADAAQVARWEAFVASCPDATFFHRAGWERLIREVFRHDTHFLQAVEGDQLRGILPLAHVQSRLFGRSLSSLPFAAYGGIAALDDAATGALLDHARGLAQRLGVEHLELRHLQRRRPEWPEQALYVTFRKPIEATEEANMLAIPRKQRAMVRKGIKNGLVSTIDDDVDAFFALYADNVHRHGTPALSRRYFEALREVFGADCEVLTVRSAEGRALSSVLSFYFRDEVLPYYAGDDLAARDLAANDFKYWELMRRACGRGLKVFDYGRSKVGTGPYAFKKNWGFEPTQLHYEYQLFKRDAIPQNNPANPKYRLMIEAWRRLPLPVANWLGPHIVRNLG